MNDEAIRFYAKKFFPHMLPRHGESLIRQLLKIYNVKQEPTKGKL